MAAAPPAEQASTTADRTPILRLLVCGSVDDGKSTLIGRLLLDTDQVPEDQVAALERDSRVHGTTGGGIDPALLTDGLSAEREQGITIDVAWRQFQAPGRRILIADTPGHVQHTRNMATGASGCRAAVVLVDAAQGVLEQTRRHTTVVALMGIRRVVFAVNKMDLVGCDPDAFARVAVDCRALAAAAGLPPDGIDVIPVIARDGDNVVRGSERLGWWEGPTLLGLLESLDVGVDARAGRPLRFPVQLVVRPDARFRGYAGTVMAGVLRVGDGVRALPSGVRSRIERIVTFDGDLDAAGPGSAVTVVLADELDLARGDLLVPEDEPEATAPLRSHAIDATLVWLDAEPYATGRRLLLRSHTGSSGVTIRRVAHTVDMTTLETRPAAGVGLNDVVRVELAVEREHVLDPYGREPATGSFVLVDRATQAVVAAGLAHGIPSPFDRAVAGAMLAQPSLVAADERRTRLGHAAVTVTVTGMSGTGKSTLARALERRLFDLGATVVRLDGEALRLGLSRGLGFGPEERAEHLRRAAETARLLNDHGQLVILAAQAPAREVRARMAAVIGLERYVEVHLHAPADVRRRRDPSGAHAAVARGDAPELPGITVGYEPPERPDAAFDTSATDLAASVEELVVLLRARGVLGAADPSGAAGGAA
jgi:bifunctional enzyme CysN/CysC